MDLERELLIRLFSTEDERVSWGLTRELSAVERHLGKPTLAEGVVNAGFRRAIDIGVGRNFENIKHLANLHHDGQVPFTPDNLWAIDNDLLPDSQLRDKLALYKYRFTRECLSAEEMAARIASGQTGPFDLVLSRGVVSIGGHIDYSDPQQGYPQGLALIRSLVACLNPRNPNALVVMSDVDPEEVLPFAEPDLNRLGLEVVLSEPPLTEHAGVWTEILQRGGFFPPPPYNSFYNLVVSRRVDSGRR